MPCQVEQQGELEKNILTELVFLPATRFAGLQPLIERLTAWTVLLAKG